MSTWAQQTGCRMSRLPSWSRDVVVAGSGGRAATLIPTHPRGTSRPLDEAQRHCLLPPPAGRLVPSLSCLEAFQKAFRLVSRCGAWMVPVWRIRRARGGLLQRELMSCHPRLAPITSTPSAVLHSRHCPKQLPASFVSANSARTCRPSYLAWNHSFAAYNFRPPPTNDHLSRHPSRIRGTIAAPPRRMRLRVGSGCTKAANTFDSNTRTRFILHGSPVCWIGPWAMPSFPSRLSSGG
ncbi:hypothetical protein P171DRAFT_210307 [Karstenula rhodostoma CBS 690.94]|uniref:Uncharacterized protein n=1 Tax=Karstenula rhodostoma CBS 690.94 TaxID=1392251 RepID=A0A9P4UGJ6_9PLEO|nr:hypothetical protein P171DRAFT_210307 [Karstenula rhodostoma CBS 690.94]